jgi:hypothetical protein
MVSAVIRGVWISWVFMVCYVFVLFVYAQHLSNGSNSPGLGQWTLHLTNAINDNRAKLITACMMAPPVFLTSNVLQRSYHSMHHDHFERK